MSDIVASIARFIDRAWIETLLLFDGYRLCAGYRPVYEPNVD